MHAPLWLSRFLRWLLAATLLGVLVPPVFHFAAKRFDPYKLAIQTARQNHDFIDLLGSPVTEGWFFDGKEQLGDPATARLLIPVRGSTRAGNLRVQAIKEHGRWRLTQLTLELANPGKTVDLLEQKPI
jgi:hypothetical protein